MSAKRRRLFARLAPYLLIGAAFVVALAIVLSYESANYRRALNREVASIANAVQETYPETSEETIVAILQNAYERAALEEVGDGFLRRYGYRADVFYAESARAFAGMVRTTIAVWATAFALTMIAAFFLRQYLYRKQIEALIAYVRDVSDGVYDLKIADNSEETISLLTNEIYKIAVRLKESAEQSRMESENLSRALADISHQIKTPLTGVQITLDNLYDHPDMDAATRQRFLRAASAQIDATSSLVVALLNLAKFDSGTIRLLRSEVRMGDLLRRAIDELAIYAEVKEIAPTLSGDVDATITIDERWELEAYKNILKNAIEHSHTGGRIFLEIENAPLFLKVIVRDEGEGVSANDLKHIFERFYKSEGAGKESFGIGLSFARTVIEADGGFITADSIKGEGTTFTVRYKK